MISNLVEKYNAFMRGIGPWGVIFLRIGSGILILWILFKIYPNDIINSNTPFYLVFIIWGIPVMYGLWNLVDGFFMIFGSQGIISQIPLIGMSTKDYTMRCPYCGKKLHRGSLGRIKCGFCYQYFDI
jgi:hypothetical protein